MLGIKERKKSLRSNKRRSSGRDTDRRRSTASKVSKRRRSSVPGTRHRHSHRRHSEKRTSNQEKMLKRLQDFESEVGLSRQGSQIDLNRLSTEEFELEVKPKPPLLIRMTLFDWCTLFALIELVFGAALLGAKISVILAGKQGKLEITVFQKRLPLVDYIEVALSGGTLLSGIILFIGAKLQSSAIAGIHVVLSLLCLMLLIGDILIVHVFEEYWWLTFIQQGTRLGWVFLYLSFGTASLLLTKRLCFAMNEKEKPIPYGLARLSLLRQNKHNSVI